MRGKGCSKNGSRFEGDHFFQFRSGIALEVYLHVGGRKGSRIFGLEVGIEALEEEADGRGAAVVQRFVEELGVDRGERALVGLGGVSDDPLDGRGVFEDAVEMGAREAGLGGELEEGVGSCFEESASEGPVGGGGLEAFGERRGVGLGDGNGAGCRRGECLRSSVRSSGQVR